MNMRSSSLICSMLIYTMLLLCAGMSQAAEYPKQVKDGRDKLVVIKQQPKRIVSISTFGADLMAGLGLKVAGMSSMGNHKPPFLDHTADQARDLGAAQETNMELLAQLKPDLVIGIRSYTEMYEKKFEEISSFITYDFITLENSNFAVEQVAKAVGKEAEGQRMNQDFVAMLNRYGSKAKGGVSAVFVWHWADVLWAHYDHYLTADIMQALKIRNATGASNTPNMINPHARVMSMEELLKLDPDYTFSFQAGDKAIQSHPAWKRLKAVKNGHAYRVGQQYAEVHGPLARQMVLEEMAWLVYPDTFPRPQYIPDAARAKPLAFRK